MLATVSLVAVVRSESIVAAARDSRDDWGRQVRVFVASRDLEPGVVIGPDDTVETMRPAIVVPGDIAHDPGGRTVTQPVAAGEIILQRRLSGGGNGVTSLLGPGELAFAIPVDPMTPSLRIGAHVDVFAPVDTASRSAVGATKVATRATVVAVAERTVTIGVDEQSGAALARALLGSTVVLALVE